MSKIKSTSKHLISVRYWASNISLSLRILYMNLLNFGWSPRVPFCNSFPLLCLNIFHLLTFITKPNSTYNKIIIHPFPVYGRISEWGLCTQIYFKNFFFKSFSSLLFVLKSTGEKKGTSISPSSFHKYVCVRIFWQAHNECKWQQQRERVKASRSEMKMFFFFYLSEHDTYRFRWRMHE